MVNRESIPLLLAIVIPAILVSLILLYHYGYDITLVLRKIHIIYYIIVLPIALGLAVGIIKYMRPDY